MRGLIPVFVGCALAGVRALATGARADDPVQARIDARPSAAASSASRAVDDPSPAAQQPGAPVHRTWYGHEILAIDSLSLILPFLAFASNSQGVETVVGVAGLGGYLFGDPIVHAANGRGAGIVL